MLTNVIFIALEFCENGLSSALASVHKWNFTHSSVVSLILFLSGVLFFSSLSAAVCAADAEQCWWVVYIAIVASLTYAIILLLFMLPIGFPFVVVAIVFRSSFLPPSTDKCIDLLPFQFRLSHFTVKNLDGATQVSLHSLRIRYNSRKK